ncbi:phosphatase 2C-like domain-containing protein [Cantharellus anzutake]|uniref:phosphatase 2C-like domain-containing protein n=1 Tax=Cantharellus anzutake TaxID=1750568 RepID=UPI0019087F7E|nr:phosphatase 2C-like domain-containing protein [Cantharellus anzutake]KAF8343156.1 phosphatase 2C-like domain-containing protein [Cantharellus anzutake]
MVLTPTNVAFIRSRTPYITKYQPLISARRSFHDYIRYPTADGRMIKLSVTSEKLIGVASSRGMRPYQEDAYTITSVHLPIEGLQYGLTRNFGISWNPGLRDLDLAGQLLFVGLYDGHGGQTVSHHLRDHLHPLFETADASEAPKLINWLKSYSGYFRRYKGGCLEELTRDAPSTQLLDMEARATLAFLMADYDVCQSPEMKRCGATASVAILHPLEIPHFPFFASEYQALTVAHCGDTRAILCSTETGKAFPMTEVHHADTRGEAARLRRIGTGLVTDSFGEARWMGAVANTRGLGDTDFKPFGVTPEPEVRRRILRNRDWAFLAMVSDGISSELTDDEICDLARGATNAREAADSILRFVEELGGEDNATVIIVPLSGWGQVRGPDRTADLRIYRLQQAGGSTRQRRM